ncbi:uncharacterized protein PgNI_11771 [Pyricularia grisea]|uniref:Uncharacterized protein n=1 Tax=Pyricularia grisea TaxID=148305 RepID=A0A6P8AP07_PYRGI|nr:uncharacterized protein PgNI_11771 [Pyricularia grisea]TLD03779.1 hypothetical protein PgNI_11771 [Pyricularia grisea]
MMLRPMLLPFDYREDEEPMLLIALLFSLSLSPSLCQRQGPSRGFSSQSVTVYPTHSLVLLGTFFPPLALRTGREAERERGRHTHTHPPRFRCMVV